MNFTRLFLTSNETNSKAWDGNPSHIRRLSSIFEQRGVGNDKE